MIVCKRGLLIVISGLLAALSLPGQARADGGYGPVVLGIYSVSANIVPVGVAAYGSDADELTIKHHAGLLDLSGDYVSTRVLLPGTTIVRNFNLYNGATLLETLNIVLTGESPDSFDADNLSVDVHARSNFFGVLSPLPGGPITLLYNLQVPKGWFDLSGDISANGGPADFGVSVEALAPVPEPSSIGLLFGVVGTALAMRLRRR